MTYLFFLAVSLFVAGVSYFYMPEDWSFDDQLSAAGVMGLLTFIVVTPLPALLVVPIMLYAGYQNPDKVKELMGIVRDKALRLVQGDKVEQIEGNADKKDNSDQFLKNDDCDYDGGCGHECECKDN